MTKNSDDMSDYDKEIEEMFLDARADHEEGMDFRLIELDRKGNWLHKNWFTMGVKAQKEKDAGRIKTLSEVIDMQAAMIEGMRRVVAVARMVNGQRSDIRMEHALKDYDKCKIKTASGASSNPLKEASEG